MGRVSVWDVHGDELDESGEMSAPPGEGLSVDIGTIAAEVSWKFFAVFFTMNVNLQVCCCRGLGRFCQLGFNFSDLPQAGLSRTGGIDESLR